MIAGRGPAGFNRKLKTENQKRSKKVFCGAVQRIFFPGPVVKN
jgi:hypothetical protein